MVRISILCAMRDRRAALKLSMELEDKERCAFRVAANGREALEAARSFAPDILIVDAVLPQMDGFGLIDRMREMPGMRMPRVIGGSMMRFADEGFMHRGVAAALSIPWNVDELHEVLLREIRLIRDTIDWKAAKTAYQCAKELLNRLGMRSSLKGYDYLAWATALAYENEARLEAVGDEIYEPIAREFDTTAQNVERLIRQAVERTMDGERAKGVYSFFGNTIDPTRGKPTNAQCISALAERLRIS